MADKNNNANITGFNSQVDITGALTDFEKGNPTVEEINPNNLTASKPTTESQANTAISDTLKQFENGIGVLKPIEPNEFSLRSADGVMSPQEADDRNRAMKLSKELGEPMEAIEGELLDRSESEIRAERRIPQISKLYPTLNKWASRPDNYVLVNRNVDYIQGVNKTFEALNNKKLTDVEKAISKGILNYRRSLIDVSMAAGLIDVEQGKKVLRELDQAQARNEYVEALPGLVKLQEESEDLQQPFENFLNGLSEAYTSAKESNLEEAYKNILESGKAGADAAGEFWDLITTLYDNPESAKVFAVDTLMSSAPSIGAGIAAGATIEAATKSKLAALVGGGVAAASVSFPLEFSGKFRGELEQFRDPNTGEIDYDEAFSDPERVKQWRKEAAVFAGVISSSDALYSMIIGKPFAKLVRKVPGKGGKLVGAASEVVTGATEEAASNVTAEAASQAVSPEGVSAESLSAKAGDFAQEALGGGIAGGGIGITLGAARSVLDSGSEKYNKIKSEISESNKAVEKTVSLSNARSKVKEDPIGDQYDDQIDELAEQSMEADVPETEADIYDDAENITAEELSNEETRASSGTIEFSPSKITEYFINEENLSVEEALDGLPSYIYEEYTRNRETDNSVSVPISDWVRVTEEFPEIDAFVRINGEEKTAQEAQELQQEIEDEPFKLFQERDDLPPPVPQQEAQQAPEVDTQEVQEGEPSEVTPISEISSRFRLPDEQEAFKSLQRIMRKATKEVQNIPEEALQIATEIQFRRAVNRAEVLQVPVTEIVEQLKTTRGAGRAQGVLITRRGLEGGTLGLDMTADPATLIHELGHLWLTDMSVDYFKLQKTPFAEMTDAQRSYWDSMKLAAKHLGLDNVGELNNLDGESFTAVQETFAQTTEKYFLDGEFGDSTIRGLMESFRKFLVSIAEMVGTAYKQYPALPITPEIERMFEGILAPKKKSDQVMLPLFPEPSIPVDMMGPDAEKYYEDIRASLAETVASFMSRTMKRKYRDREAVIDEILNSAYDEARQKVESMPEMQLMAEMEQSYDEFYKLKKAGRKVPDPRISFNTFAEIVGDEQAAARMRNSLRKIVAPRKKGGSDVYLVMWANDVNNPDQFAKILNLMSQKDAIIDREAQNIVKESMPVLKNDEEIQQETNEALKDANLSTLFRRELKVMADKYLPSLMRTGEIMGKSPESWLRESITTEKARDVLSETVLHNFNPKKFRADFRKFAKEAAKSFRQGNFTKAFEQKVKEIISYKAFIQSIDAQKLVLRTKKRVKQFQRYSKVLDYADVFDADVMTYGNQLISSFESGQRELPKLFTPDASDPSRVEIPDVSGVSISDVYRINSMIDSFNQMSGGRRGFNTTVGVFVQFGEVVKAVQGTARRAKMLEIAGRDVKIEDARSNVALEFSSSTSMVRNYKVEDGITIKYRADKDQMQTVVASLYDSDEEYTNSAAGALMDQVDRGQASRNTQYDELRNRVLEAVEKGVKASKNKGALERYLMPIFRRLPYVSGRIDVVSKEARPIDATEELGITFNNLAEYWMAELLMGSESGAEKFMMGGTESRPEAIGTYDFETGKIDRTQFNKLRQRLIDEGILVKEHFDMLQEIWDTFAELHPQVKKVLRETDGFNMGKVEGSAFEVFGTKYSGGYVPVSAIDELSTVADFDKVMSGDPASMAIGNMYPSQNTGMSQERKQYFYPVDLNMNNVLLYLSAATDIIHLRKPMTNFYKVFKSPEVKESLETKRPGAMKNVMIPWFERVLKQRRTQRGLVKSMDSVARSFRKNLNRSIYLGRITTAMIQYTGLLPVMNKVGAVNVGRGMMEFHKDIRGNVKFINESSEIMRNRFQGNIRRHIEEWDTLINNFDWVRDFDEIISRVTFFTIQTAQNHVDRMAWMGSYISQIKKNGNDHDAAVKYADFIINSTQASSDVSWLNNWQSSTPTLKLLTGVATSYVFSINNVVTREVARSENKTRMVQTLITMSLLYYGLNQAMDKFIREAIDSIGDDDEEVDEDKLENIIGQTAIGMFGLHMPIVGQIPEGFLYTGRLDGAPAINKIFRTGTTSVYGSKNLSQGVPLSVYEMKSMLELITLTTGIPTSVLGKDLFLEEVLIEGVFDETIEGRNRQRRRKKRRLRRQDN